MKKVFFVFILIYGQLFALERESTLKMYHGIFSALSSKASIKVYTKDKEYKEVFTHSKRIFLSDKLEEADIVLITEVRTLNNVLYTGNANRDVDKKPIIFVTDHHFLKMADDIVGAFYWRKGRSQLLFINKRLKEHNITLPKEYQKFMIDEL